MGAPPAPALQPPLPHTVLYGLFALPLAFAALPLYVQWPAHAAGTWALPLGWVGLLLLAVRVLDAFVDPWLGARVDGLFARSARRAWGAAGAAAAAIALGMAGLFFAPPALRGEPHALLAWAAAALVLTSLGYSLAMVTHQAWAVRLGGGTAEQARWVGARETLALAGVLVASVLPSMAGWAVTVALLAGLLIAGWLTLARVLPREAAPAVIAGPAAAGGSEPCAAPSRSPWLDAGFRRLMAVVLASGLASAIPASLVLFYVRDVLQAAGAAEGWLLGLYFASAALGMPLWVRAVRRHGLVRPWLASMGLAIASFAGAALLGAGDLPLFALVCLVSGLALGAELVVPPALLAALIRRHRAEHAAPMRTQAGAGPRGIEGLWFGWWNFTAKLTLAAAAGLALPLVQALGYAPGVGDANSLTALAICYALVPCAVKALAAALVWRWRISLPDAQYSR
ncbi:MAG: MFS transporter [Rubrivivax sp.]|nr:MFS transporter [Rubrivivax sp.]